MARYDIRQDKSYRRGLVLGLTMAEIMILLIFVLLMALASALATREKKLEAFEGGAATRLVDAMQEAYPKASADDYYKELVRAIEARKQIETLGEQGAQANLVEDASLGKDAREAAEKAGAPDPAAFAREAIEKARVGKKGEWPPFFSLSEAGGYYFESGKATLKTAFEAKLGLRSFPP